MSVAFNKSDVLFQQRLLKSAGLYHGALDGLWGKQTEGASIGWRTWYERDAEKYGYYDTRSEKNIFTVLPKMQVKARQILRAAYDWSGRRSFTFSILSGTRTYAEQNALFAKRPKVTNARGGQSWHNFGVAIDIGIFDMKGKYLTGANKAENQAYADLADAVEKAVPGLELGIRWKSFVDPPHYQMTGGNTISQARAKFEAGKLFL